ncbi:hypothetical protein HG530_010812 [Fusarium avenaceum]|nr:hypothetical protein HG530_010812 [Fusarium avenaceum]
MDPPPYEHLTREIASELSHLARLSRTVASKKPGDQNAQRRAQAATAFVSWYIPGGNKSPLPGLPIELYQLIVSYVAKLDCKIKFSTLRALSSTCRLFMGLAEEHLYSHPRDLDDIRKQWLFLYSLRMEPTRATLVKSLRLLWLGDGSNMKLLIDIVASCRNSKALLIERGNYVQGSEKISHDDMLNMGALIRACPELTWLCYSTTNSTTPEDEWYTDTVNVTGDGVVNPLSDDAHLKQSMSQLSKLSLTGQAKWLLNGLSPHLASSLTSLVLGDDLYFGNWEDPLTQLSRQCPFLEVIDIDQTLDTATDLEEACKAWGKTLKVLKVYSVEEVNFWVTRIMPYMVSLEELVLGLGCLVQAEDIEAIARSKSPLKQIQLRDMHSSEEPIEFDAMNASLVAMIEAHSSTLQYLGLYSHPFVDISVLQACRKAKNLTSLYLYLWIHATPEPTDVDILLDTCVDLDDVPDWFLRYSSREDEWKARKSALEFEESEARKRRPQRSGLGFGHGFIES